MVFKFKHLKGRDLSSRSFPEVFIYSCNFAVDGCVFWCCVLCGARLAFLTPGQQSCLTRHSSASTWTLCWGYLLWELHFAATSYAVLATNAICWMFWCGLNNVWCLLLFGYNWGLKEVMRLIWKWKKMSLCLYVHVYVTLSHCDPLSENTNI